MSTIFLKGESVNTKQAGASIDAAPIADRHKKKEFTPSFFPPNEMQRALRCSMRKMRRTDGIFS
jgi:hypothetical protein